MARLKAEKQCCESVSTQTKQRQSKDVTMQCDMETKLMHMLPPAYTHDGETYLQHVFDFITSEGRVIKFKHLRINYHLCFISDLASDDIFTPTSLGFRHREGFGKIDNFGFKIVVVRTSGFSSESGYISALLFKGDALIFTGDFISGFFIAFDFYSFFGDFLSYFLSLPLPFPCFSFCFSFKASNFLSRLLFFLGSSSSTTTTSTLVGVLTGLISKSRV